MQTKLRLLFFVLSFFTLVSFPFAEKIHAQLDPTFGTNGIATANPSVSDFPIASFGLPDGKTLIVSGNQCCSLTNKLFLVRFNENGTLDSSYGNNGIIEIIIPYTSPEVGEINGAARQPDGKIILVGRDSNNRGLVARFNEDGTPDTSFADGGFHRPDIAPFNERDRILSALIQPDGKILVAGFAGGTYPKLSFLRYHSNGALDTSFGTNGTGFIIHNSITLPLSEGAESFYLQSNGKIIVGNIRESNGGYDPVFGAVRRFNSDGSIDTGFTTSTYPGFNEFKTLSLQPDDKILVSTVVTKNETLERVHTDSVIKRLNPDGSTDTSFGSGGQSSFDITGYQNDKPVAVQAMPDGQILVAVVSNIGSNRSIYRREWLSLARLSSSGEIIGKFLAARATDGEKGFISILPDGKILTVFSTVIPGNDILLVRATGVPLVNYKLRGIPFDFPIFYDGAAKPSVYRQSEGKWLTYPNTFGAIFGLSDDIPVPSDYIKNFDTDYAFFRPSNGTWYIARNTNSIINDFLEIRWGLAGDIPHPNDYDGDGKSDVAVFRPSNGVWYILNSADNSYTIFQWGLNGDKPAAGDFDGDGLYDIAVFRPSDGNWYILKSSDGGYAIVHFGLEGDIPVQEDYDGDGRTDIAVYRPSSGVWYRLNSSDGSFFAFQWGLPSDIPVPGDYDSDLKTNIAVWRPSNSYWYIVNPDHNSMHSYVFGMPTDLPLPGKF